jgi:hypothetical protein
MPSARRSVDRVSCTSVPIRFARRIRDLANVICCTAPAPSPAIRGVLGKLVDLPQEAENEIRSPDEARAESPSWSGKSRT